jgi:hypothetical protein
MQSYLSVGAIFKNEGHALREWCEHYFHHGAEHIYLIDDGSDDGGSETIRDYVERGDVTLFREDAHPYYLGRQVFLYNSYILPHVDRTHWLLVLDLDEFMWSPQSVDLRPVLAEFDDTGLLMVHHTLFGSNGHVDTPRGIVASYTRRAASPRTTPPFSVKSFVNCSIVEVSSISGHQAACKAKASATMSKQLADDEKFVLNHYNCQSWRFWCDVKCTRGDAANLRTRTPDDFKATDINEIEDTRLWDQNRCLEGATVSVRA